MNRAICYIRVSTVEQATEGVSLEAQEAAVRAYCAMRGLEVVDVVTDAGVSAGKALDRRQGGRRILEAVKRRQVDAVVVFKLDRLFRDCADCLTVTSAWDRQGVGLHLIDMGGQTVDTSSAMGRFFLTVMAGAAEMERNLIRERTTAALAYKSTKGERVGQVPFGYTVDADGVVLVALEAEQSVIAIVLDLKRGGQSIRSIAGYLNEQKVPARGKRWHATTVSRIIKRNTVRR